MAQSLPHGTQRGGYSPLSGVKPIYYRDSRVQRREGLAGDVIYVELVILRIDYFATRRE